jgi:hypothetical protein
MPLNTLVVPSSIRTGRGNVVLTHRGLQQRVACRVELEAIHDAIELRQRLAQRGRRNHVLGMSIQRLSQSSQDETLMRSMKWNRVRTFVHVNQNQRTSCSKCAIGEIPIPTDGLADSGQRD